MEIIWWTLVIMGSLAFVFGIGGWITDRWFK